MLLLCYLGLIDWCLTPTLAIFQLYRGVLLSWWFHIVVSSCSKIKVPAWSNNY